MSLQFSCPLFCSNIGRKSAPLYAVSATVVFVCVSRLARRIKEHNEYNFNAHNAWLLLIAAWNYSLFMFYYILQNESKYLFPLPHRIFVLNIMEATAENVPRGQFYLFTANKRKSYWSIAMEVNDVSNKDCRETTHSHWWAYVSYNTTKLWYIGLELRNGSVVVQFKFYHIIYTVRLHVQCFYNWFGWQEIDVLSKGLQIKKGKVLRVPWRRMGEWNYSSIILDLGTRWRWVASVTLLSL
jgi:hypothetical protein